MQKRRIAIFISSLEGGGAERQTVNLANFLALDENNSIDLLVGKAIGTNVDRVCNNVNLIDFNKNRVSLTGFELIKYLYKNKPDVLFSVLDHVNVLTLLIKVSRILNIKVIVSVRAQLTSALRSFSNGKEKLLFILTKFLYPFADHVVAVSQGVAYDLLKQIPRLKNKLSVIYNPTVNNEIFDLANHPVDHPWFGSDKKEPIFLSIGRLTEQKDYITLIKAFALLRKEMSAKLVILGEGSNDYKQKLLQLIIELSLTNDVELSGFVFNPYKYLKNCSVFVLSSRYEGLPGVLIEALALAPAIVSTDCPSGPREILDNGKYGYLVPVENPILLSKAMQDACQIKTKDTIDKEIFLKNFSPEKIVEQYLNLFDKIIPEKTFK